MTKKQLKELINKMEKSARKSIATPKKAMDLLVRAGICTPKGNLKRPYR